MDINEAWPGWTNTQGSGIIRTGIAPPAVINTGDHHAATDVTPPTLTQEDAPVEVDDAASDTPPPPPHALTEALDLYAEKKARLQDLQESIENAITIANTIGAEWVAATDAMDTVHLMRTVSATATKERDAFYAKMREGLTATVEATTAPVHGWREEVETLNAELLELRHTFAAVHRDLAKASIAPPGLECSICYAAPVDTALQCGHVFCGACLDMVHQPDCGGRCPACKNRIGKFASASGMLRIYFP